MVPKKHRLRGQTAFRTLARQGRHVHEPALAIRVRPNQMPESRFGFVVSLRISKKATRRNRLKRQLREIVRLELPRIRPGYDVMVMVKPNALSLGYWQLKEQLITLLTKARLL